MVVLFGHRNLLNRSNGSREIPTPFPYTSNHYSRPSIAGGLARLIKSDDVTQQLVPAYQNAARNAPELNLALLGGDAAANFRRLCLATRKKRDDSYPKKPNGHKQPSDIPDKEPNPRLDQTVHEFILWSNTNSYGVQTGQNRLTLREDLVLDISKHHDLSDTEILRQDMESCNARCGHRRMIALLNTGRRGRMGPLLKSDHEVIIPFNTPEEYKLFYDHALVHACKLSFNTRVARYRMRYDENTQAVLVFGEFLTNKSNRDDAYGNYRSFVSAIKRENTDIEVVTREQFNQILSEQALLLQKSPGVSR